MTSETRATGWVHRLADRVGILPEYLDQTGKETRRTSDATRIAILAAMGIDASIEERAREALEELDARAAARMLAPARVVVEAKLRALVLELTLPDVGWKDGFAWEAELRQEDGSVLSAEGRRRQARGGPVGLRVPWRPAPGYHDLVLKLKGSGATAEASQRLIIVPPSCPRPERILHRRRVAGIVTNLYTVRSNRNWGVGDLGDLRFLAKWAGRAGADFVGVNPLHALRNRGADISPYSPVSRLFRNPLYIDVAAIPEMRHSEDARRLVAGGEHESALQSLRDADQLDYEAVMSRKMPVLRALHATHRARTSGAGAARQRAFRTWVESQGGALEDFATFCALEEHLAENGRARPDGSWRDWPEPYRDPRSEDVRRFREGHRAAVEFHEFLQWVLDEQLEGVAREASAAGMAIGLYQDLAIGTSPDGSDTWSFQHLFASGVSVGAPPDMYSANGQNWGLPPIDPTRLADDRYEYWIALVRACLAHAGALRIDHVLGLFRQFWIPEGKSGREGAYVRFPVEALAGILALESSRAGALVVGEDLGTVPKEVPRAMKRLGLLSSKVMYFERDARGRFRAADRYQSDSLATANTHDMPTLEGFWRGRDIDVRVEVGLGTADEVEQQRLDREKELAALLRRLELEGVIEDAADPPEGAGLRGAVHEFLCRTKSALVGLSLDDITGETEPVNVPGVGADRFPSWTRRMSMPVERLPDDDSAALAMRCRRLRAR